LYIWPQENYHKQTKSFRHGDCKWALGFANEGPSLSPSWLSYWPISSGKLRTSNLSDLVGW
jgi:hypothetical protein